MLRILASAAVVMLAALKKQNTAAVLARALPINSGYLLGLSLFLRTRRMRQMMMNPAKNLKNTKKVESSSTTCLAQRIVAVVRYKQNAEAKMQIPPKASLEAQVLGFSLSGDMIFL